MASKDELYFSVGSEIYLGAKLTLLSSQADLLTSLKHLHNLKILARQKRDLKLELGRRVSSTLALIESLRAKMPEAKMPKQLIVEKKQPVQEVVVEKKKKVNYSRHEEIDNELLKIQEKLRALSNH